MEEKISKKSKMQVSEGECSVETCKKYEAVRGDYLFPLPNDKRREGWITFLENQFNMVHPEIEDETFFAQPDTAICSLHFEKRWLLEYDGKTHLSTEAIPTISHKSNGQLKVKSVKVLKFCRFCFASTHKFLSLADLDTIGIDSSHLFIALRLSNSYQELPQVTCLSCFERIKKFWTFVETAKKAEQEMFDFYRVGKKEIKKEKNVDIADIKDIKEEVLIMENENFVMEFDELIEEKAEDLEEPEEPEEEDAMMDKDSDSDYTPKQEKKPVKEEDEDSDETDGTDPADDFLEVFTESEKEEAPDPFANETDIITRGNPKVILRKFKCKVPACGKVFGGRKFFEQHKCDLTEFKCDRCPKVFTKRSQLITHISSRHNKIRWSRSETRKCPMCKKLFKSSLRKFKLHKKKLCPERGKPIECEVCLKILPTLSGYQTHSLYHKNDVMKKPDLEVLNNHVILPNNNLCSFCGTLCETANEYMKHLENNHKDQLQKIPCPDPDCNKTFPSQRRLYGHFYACHKKDETKCDVCGKIYKNKFAYHDHFSRVHGGKNLNRERTFQCEHCPKAFFRRDSLRVHVNSHTHEVSFECEFCMKSFTTKYQCRQHTLKFHGNE